MNELIISTPLQITAYIEQAVQNALKASGLQKSSEVSGTKYKTHVEAAKYLGISDSTLYSYCSKGQIAYFNRGKKNYFDPAELDAFIQKSRKSTTAEQVALMQQKMRSKGGRSL